MAVPDAVGHSVPVVGPHVLVELDVLARTGVLQDALVVQLLVERAQSGHVPRHPGLSVGSYLVVEPLVEVLVQCLVQSCVI